MSRMENITGIEAPVLLIGFNRPDVIAKSFELIRTAKPKYLFLAVDGPRAQVKGEAAKVQQVIDVISQIDWDCEVNTKFNKDNLGAEVAISTAISWALQNHPYVIVIEDDILAPLSFFKFAQEMLVRYEHEDRISRVTGNNYTPIEFPNQEDYCFAKYGKTWGWATWKREWDRFDLNAPIDPKHCEYPFLRTITNSRKEARYFRLLFKRMLKNGKGNNTWDYMALYYHRVQNKLAVIPRTNLTSNIGVEGLHTHGVNRDHFRPVDENFQVKKHPDKVSYFKDYDLNHFDTYVKMPAGFLKKVYIKLNLLMNDIRERYKR